MNRVVHATFAGSSLQLEPYLLYFEHIINGTTLIVTTFSTSFSDDSKALNF
ncbi:MAG: hypothetical protein HW390_3091 [Candidatus Brocadiaceae bacterium]|nr:hypothetical protein [Candidatus Brocadiaceae bacterium]